MKPTAASTIATTMPATRPFLKAPRLATCTAITSTSIRCGCGAFGVDDTGALRCAIAAASGLVGSSATPGVLPIAGGGPTGMPGGTGSPAPGGRGLDWGVDAARALLLAAPGAGMPGVRPPAIG